MFKIRKMLFLKLDKVNEDKNNRLEASLYSMSAKTKVSLLFILILKVLISLRRHEFSRKSFIMSFSIEGLLCFLTLIIFMKIK
jgi:hypothetical protein